ncbi:MAG: Fic family protein, partial [Cyclobacteriaceae bacterium]|nr:Fic family protein [Cyclobacteriaceae bacterium]
MLDIDQVLTIHKKLIQEFGGIQGLRDKEMLESALSRPFQTFDGRELYPSIEEKAAAILESLLLNHPFIDGNKRIGYTLFRLLILSENKDIISSMDERY